MKIIYCSLCLFLKKIGVGVEFNYCFKENLEYEYILFSKYDLYPQFFKNKQTYAT